jgi:hypothetical protein
MTIKKSSKRPLSDRESSGENQWGDKDIRKEQKLSSKKRSNKKKQKIALVDVVQEENEDRVGMFVYR